MQTVHFKLEPMTRMLLSRTSGLLYSNITLLILLLRDISMLGKAKMDYHFFSQLCMNTLFSPEVITAGTLKQSLRFQRPVNIIVEEKEQEGEYSKKETEGVTK